ncbi:iron-containing alcohol dehydrogenase [Neorhizobium galegae]|uniref:iron-containing alcohol dehydrogenase n=1 Tax=Neorhizobium galegae TaxID=399 RepID=UPI0006217281|nr:iron-containing alcohol dehydrogenase [Neorhizobium galegae]CDZ60126.1 Alcohol dehydrogenase, iron-dependent [Neorhizobium galegae bv. orientalis]KAB1121023.1 iron-containing alcohol dehydrogenase [Neorhizobium galegae]MCQ1574582.1 iron-containing alcohol dehydrogenase [Neorhizobium galegae]MCQ1808993.1 iron-containing alcohol dehydrogenase [Neorhizobium galegae]CDZ64721.1 Alcohol dehydrogenase, iron-dependent [Neorhizobium galegae bv. orientalis]
MSTFTFATVPQIIAGPGSIARLSELTTLLGSRVLVISDDGVVKAGLVQPALASLSAGGAGTSLFTGVVADPPEAIIHAAVTQAIEFGATGVLGIGGGSSLDVAKLVALLCRSGEALDDIYGVGKVSGQRLPLVLVPTTAGTGSEVTPISIVTTGAYQKKGVVSPVLLPDASVLDAELTLGLPPTVTAATGIDAMVHAIEAFTSASANNNPVSRTLAKEALRLLGANIEIAVMTGTDLAARQAMLLGAMLAGQAFANSPVAAVHALAYPVGGRYHVPHGLSNSLVLPHVLRFNATVCGDAYAELAPCLYPHLEPAGQAERISGFIEGLAMLPVRLNLPVRLRDVGIPKDGLPLLAESAMEQTRLLVNNPRTVSLPEAVRIYEVAW